MGLFSFRARRADDGRVVSGEFYRDSEKEALEYLAAQGLLVLSLKEKGDSSQALARLFSKRVSPKERAFFYRQMATMIRAGLPLLSALRVAEAQAKIPLRKYLADIRDYVSGGETFYEALSRFPSVFPKIQVEMVKAAENSGLMEDVLERLARETEKEVRVIGKVRSAVTYPAIVLTVTFFVVAVLITFVIPTFDSMLSGMGVTLPATTRFVFAVARLLKDFWMLPLLVVIGISVLLAYWSKDSANRRTIDRLILRIPVAGPLLRTLALGRLCRNLAALLGSGVPLLGALKMAGAVCGNRYYEGLMQSVSHRIQDGSTLAASLEETGAVPPLMTQMVSAGEDAGALEEMVGKVADFFEIEADETLNNLTSMLEPLLVVFVGGVIALVALAVFLPLLSLVTSVGRTL